MIVKDIGDATDLTFLSWYFSSTLKIYNNNNVRLYFFDIVNIYWSTKYIYYDIFIVIHFKFHTFDHSQDPLLESLASFIAYISMMYGCIMLR